MPGHYSYADTIAANRYYDSIEKFLSSNPEVVPAVVRAAMDILGSRIIN